MTSYTSKISEASVLQQAVLNTISSIELLREAVSNSVDADARNIAIRLENSGGELWTIVIEDDGNGMEQAHMRAFFNAGETVKDFAAPAGGYLSIGEKGLGSKTTFVADTILVESRRFTQPTDLLVGSMQDPMGALRSGNMPSYEIEVNPAGHVPGLLTKGTRITLTNVHIAAFNGKKSSDPDEIAKRIMHYLRTMCATGTVKSRHASKKHVLETVINVGVVPLVTVEVINNMGNATLGPEAGSYDVPAVNVRPHSGPTNSQGVVERSKGFCEVLDFNRNRTLTYGGTTVTVHYDGTAIIAGDEVRQGMLEGELAQGRTHKSQMGVHLCKDFIPLKNDNTFSRDLLGGEFYYEYKVFLNCQNFQLTADRNGVTNQDSDEVSWIWEDFRKNVWPDIEAKAAPYNKMKADEDAATKALKRTNEAAQLKGLYAGEPDLTFTGVHTVEFSKEPRKEADVSHLLAMMVQAGHWAGDLAPIEKFGQYIDASTDMLVEDSTGSALLVEIELRLPNLFLHQHPMNSYDLVVVWELGGLGNGDTRTAPWGTNGSSVPVTLLNGAAPGQWLLKWGVVSKPVIVLKEVL